MRLETDDAGWELKGPVMESRELDAHHAGMVACREDLARWMLAHGIATGHGDTFVDLLANLSLHIDDLRRRVLNDWQAMPSYDEDRGQSVVLLRLGNMTPSGFVAGATIHLTDDDARQIGNEIAAARRKI